MLYVSMLMGHRLEKFSSNNHTFLTEPLDLKIPITKIFMWFVFVVISLLVLVPSLFNIIWAFWGTDLVGILDSQSSLTWFRSFFSSSGWKGAFLYSLILAIVVSLSGCIVLTIHFYFSRFILSPLNYIAYILTLLPVVIPAIIYALALRLVGVRLLAPEIILVFIGHCVFVIPMQFFIIESSQETVSSDTLYAGNTLGASHLVNITLNYMPLIRKPLRSAFLVGFFYSFDELVIATFIIDSTFVTVPRKLWDQVPRNMDPMPAVVAVLLLVTYLAITILFSLLSFSEFHRRRKRLSYA